MGKIMLNEIDYSGGNANVIRLTQAEYNALPPSKLTDNNVYMITDANGNGEDFQPIIYSEDEREVGVWVDGKPLYQKTFSYIGQYGGNGTLQTNLSNIDNIFIFNAYCEDTDNAFLPLPYSHYSSQYAIGIFITNSFDIAYRTSNSSQEIINPIITLQYTKTTDTAGSGTWTSQGVPAVHYSTDEQVVGTWIDGSTLYEKTVNIGKVIATGEKIYTLNIKNVDYVVDVKATPLLRQNESFYALTGGNPLWKEGSFIPTVMENNANDGLKITIYSGYYKSENDIYVTVQYTKTSQGGN